MFHFITSSLTLVLDFISISWKIFQFPLILNCFFYLCHGTCFSDLRTGHNCIISLTQQFIDRNLFYYFHLNQWHVKCQIGRINDRTFKCLNEASWGEYISIFWILLLYSERIWLFHFLYSKWSFISLKLNFVGVRVVYSSENRI